jgi:transposase
MPPPSRPGKGGRSRGGRLPAAQGEQGARPGGAAGPAPGRGHRSGQQPRCHRTSQLLGDLRLGSKRGRPRRRPEELCADGAYNTREIRHHLRRRGIRASLPANSRGRTRPKRGRPYRFCRATYRVTRAAVERFFAWLKGGFRRLALRYERLWCTFAALLYLAAFPSLGCDNASPNSGWRHGETCAPRSAFPGGTEHHRPDPRWER